MGKIRYALFAAIGLWALPTGCDEGSPRGCPGGCAAGQVCDYATGRCVDLRPATPPPDLGRYPSAAFDDAGRLQVACYAARYGDLVLGRERGDGGLDWEYVDGLPPADDPALLQDPAPIIPGPDVGLFASLALDALDRPHVAYFDRSGGRLRYATRSGQGWEIEIVPRLDGADAGPVGRAAALVLDAAGMARIAFLDETSGSVMLARKLDAERWLIERVGGCAAGESWSGPLAAEPGRSIALVLDERGAEWVAFQDPCSGALKLASRKPEGWTAAELAAGPEAGGWVSAALDADGNLAVAFSDRGAGSLRFAWNAGGTMKTRLLDAGSRLDGSGAEHRWPVGQHCTLAYGPDGLARVAYLDSSQLDLMLVVERPDGDFSDPEVLAGDGVVGLHNALVAGPDALRLLTYRLARDEQGRAAGELLSTSLPLGAALRSVP